MARRLPFLSMGVGGDPCNRLLVLGQKIPDWLIKITCLGEVTIAVRLGIKSRFCIMGF